MTVSMMCTTLRQHGEGRVEAPGVGRCWCSPEFSTGPLSLRAHWVASQGIVTCCPGLMEALTGSHGTQGREGPRSSARSQPGIDFGFRLSSVAPGSWRGKGGGRVVVVGSQAVVLCLEQNLENFVPESEATLEAGGSVLVEVSTGEEE